METSSIINTITQVSLSKLLTKYIPQVKCIAVLTVNNCYEAAIDSGNTLIKELESDISTRRDLYLPKRYALLNDCITANKKNYQAWFSTVSQALYGKENSQQELAVFLKGNLIHAKKYLNRKYYLQAICLCSAIKDWLKEYSPTVAIEYSALFGSLLEKCDTIHEFVYFYWLKLDYQNCLNYHYQQYAIHTKIMEEMQLKKQRLAPGNYQEMIDLYTSFIEKLDNYTLQVYEISPMLTLAWHKILVLQRQQIAFAWLIYGNLAFHQQVNSLKLLKQDLTQLAEAKYFPDQIKLETICKCFLVNLLFDTSIKQEQFKCMRKQFSLAFNTFDTIGERSNIALSLLGLALLNAYEGNKPEMLTGFKFAVDYDPSLSDLIHVIIRQLPFYMDPFAHTSTVLVNPLKQFSSTEIIEPPTLSPK